MNDYYEWKLTREQAANVIERFALYHANGDLPRSELTVSALKMAVDELRHEVVPIVHAKWVLIKGVQRCSRCRHVRPYDVYGDEVDYWDANYCNNCGAVMDAYKTADL